MADPPAQSGAPASSSDAPKPPSPGTPPSPDTPSGPADSPKPASPAKAPAGQGSESSDYEAAFELTGHGWFNHIVLIACSLIFMHALIEMVATAYILDPALCDLHMTVPEKGLVGSGIFIGICMSAICWGTISDRYGRRSVMLPALVLAVIASFLSSMCTAFWTMFVARIVTGILVSASMATVLVYLGELHIMAHRDRAISYAVSAVAVVFVIVPGIAWAIIPGKWSFMVFSINIKPWRVFMWSWGLIGIAGAVMLFTLPESPRFILATKGSNQALPILAAMYAKNHKKKASDFMVKAITASASTLIAGDQGIASTLKSMSQLLRPPILRCFIITHYAMFMVYLLANGIYIWMPGIFNQLLNDIHVPFTVCEIVHSLKPEATSDRKWFLRSQINDDSKTSYIWFKTPYAAGGGMDCETGSINTMMYPMAIGMEILFLIPFVFITIFIDKYDKCFLYAAVMLPCSICLGASVLIPQSLIASVTITAGLCTGSCATILTALAVDAFPTSLRALGMCTLYMMGQVGAVVGNTAVSWSVEGPCTVIFLVVAANVALSALALLFLWPDLKTVRSIMEGKGFAY